ncbi:hypothetical protein BGZ98_006422, partial [Dissophora globulifera]
PHFKKTKISDQNQQGLNGQDQVQDGPPSGITGTETPSGQTQDPRRATAIYQPGIGLAGMRQAAQQQQQQQQQQQGSQEQDPEDLEMDTETPWHKIKGAKERLYAAVVDCGLLYGATAAERLVELQSMLLEKGIVCAAEPTKVKVAGINCYCVTVADKKDLDELLVMEAEVTDKQENVTLYRLFKEYTAKADRAS